MTGTEMDSRSRNQIISEINKNFFVEAGAGSGKTTMLVSRMVAMVEAGIDISRICAITFTKAAAGEFYDRFQKMLIQRSNPNYVWEDKGYAGQLLAPTEETRQRCAEALQNIDLCFMGTIDSFCSMVLSEHPSEAHIPSDSGIMSDADIEALYRQMYVRIRAGEYGAGPADLSRNFSAFYYNDDEVFIKAIDVFMNNRNVHFNYTPVENIDIDDTFASDRKALIAAVECLADHQELISDGNEGSRKALNQIYDIRKNLKRRWTSNLSNVLYSLKVLSGICVFEQGIDTYGVSLGGLFEPGGTKDGSYRINIAGEDGTYTRLLNMQYAVSMTFLEACVPVIEQAMRDKGSLSFFDYLYYLRNMLRDDADNGGKLISYIYKRHSYFLIDEFQDTNPMQAEVFFYLTSEHPVRQWSACVPRPGSLFIVGDPKQSIYRFRSADVTSFLKVKRLFESNGGEILVLSRNFRSTATLCEYFNRVFAGLLPEETVNQSKFCEIPIPDATTDEFQGIYTYEAYTGTLEQEDTTKADYMKVPDLIEVLVDNDDLLLRGEGDENPRKIRYSDIMVITYGKDRLEPIMKQMAIRRIPMRVEGQVRFNDNSALHEIYKIYSAVSDADDGIALYGALTGSIIGMTGDEITRFVMKGGKVSLKKSFDIENCDDPTACMVASKGEELRALYLSAKGMSPAALFTGIMDEYRIFNTVDADNMEVLYYTLELIRNAERSGKVITLQDGGRYINELMSGESDEERCLSLSEGTDAVHMANLHKVKGLEAPVVIMTATSAQSARRTPDKRIVHGDEGSEGYFFRMKNPDNWGSYFETGDFADEENDEKEAGAAETQRLIYVAATRARNVLILCDSIAKAGRGTTHNSLWKPIMEAGLPDFFETIGSPDPMRKLPKRETVDSDKLYAEAEADCVLNDRSSQNGSYTIMNPSRLHLTSKVADEPEIPDDPEGSDADKAEKHRFPALLGTMTHKLMEMLVSSGNKGDAKDLVSEIIREYSTPSIEPYEKDLSDRLIEVARQMRSGGYAQSNGLPQDILTTLLTADDVCCEVPFCYSEDADDGKVIWNGVMDVVYCSEGRWHIVDYKTNADGSDLDAKYQAQLEAYKKALKTITGEEADAYTYHIDV